MAKEANLQATIFRWLRSKHCIALKYQQNATTQASVPDIIFMKDGFWGALEVKAAKNSPKRPGQEAMVKRMNEMSYARFVWPANWPDIKAELEELLRD